MIHTYRQWITLLLILLLACGGRTAACAQVAVADSLVTDSLVNDSLTMLQDRQLEILEAPIDTARLYAGSDSIHQTTTPEPVKKRWMPDPKRATWLALLIPGGGQIYNRKYWKLPIVYGGFVGCAYALTWNNQMYSDYSQAYLDLMDDDPNTDSYKDFLPPNYKIEGNESQFENIFKRKKDYYRRYRDLSIFCFIAVYALSVIDAYVDAELSNFDISKDISLKVVEGNNGKRLALYLDGGALLGQERNTLPLSTGEQNFISLAFELLRAKRSKKSIIVLDDPISSFDSIYKNKVAYLIVSMLRNDNKKKQRCILLTHNIDLLRVLDAQIEGCFSLYIMGNGAHSENGFFPVSVAEKDMLLYASSVMKALRDELLPEDILDEEMYLISIVPFVRGVARIHGYDKSFERLSQIMHGTLTKSVNISATYKWIITRRLKKEACQSDCNGYVPHWRTMLTSDKVIKRIREWRISGCPDILNPGKYGLLNKALKHIASFMYLRMYAEKVLCSKFGIDGSDMLFGNICSKAMEKARTMYPSRSEEIMEWKAGLMSKKSLVNDFNHFEGSLSIFFPAIDVSDEVLQRESDSIEAILTAIENAS